MVIDPVFLKARKMPTHCSACGYSLKGLSEPMCPECGVVTPMGAFGKPWADWRCGPYYLGLSGLISAWGAVIVGLPLSMFGLELMSSGAGGRGGSWATCAAMPCCLALLLTTRGWWLYREKMALWPRWKFWALGVLCWIGALLYAALFLFPVGQYF